MEVKTELKMVAPFKPMEDLPCVPKLRIRGIKKCVAKLPRQPRFTGPCHQRNIVNFRANGDWVPFEN